MMATRPVMEKIHEANDLLIKAKYILIQAEAMALTIEEKTYIVAVLKRVQEGIQEILKTFFPKSKFDEQAWLKRRTVKDIEHDARVQKILDESAERQLESEQIGKGRLTDSQIDILESKIFDPSVKMDEIFAIIDGIYQMESEKGEEIETKEDYTN